MVVLERGERGEESKGEVRWRKGKRGGAKVEEEVGHDKFCCIQWRSYTRAHTGPGLVSSPDPPRPRPVGKLEREKRKEGLVNRHTTTCSSAGMLAELIKTSLSKLIAYLWETVRNSGPYNEFSSSCGQTGL